MTGAPLPMAWTAQGVGDHHNIVAPSPPGARHVGTFIARLPSDEVGYDALSPEHRRMAAALIAAAPDMLAALKGISRNAALSDAWLEPVLAAIAKAEGRK